MESLMLILATIAFFTFGHWIAGIICLALLIAVVVRDSTWI
jgi:hypothetical protein